MTKAPASHKDSWPAGPPAIGQPAVCCSMSCPGRSPQRLAAGRQAVDADVKGAPDFRAMPVHIDRPPHSVERVASTASKQVGARQTNRVALWLGIRRRID
jgi:hypothetical protein